MFVLVRTLVHDAVVVIVVVSSLFGRSFWMVAGCLLIVSVCLSLLICWSLFVCCFGRFVVCSLFVFVDCLFFGVLFRCCLLFIDCRSFLIDT